MDNPTYESELEKLAQAIKAQESLRGVLPEAQLEAALSALRERQAALLSRHAGIAAGHIQATNVANVLVNLAPPENDPESLRRAYLSHLLKSVGQLSLAGIDPKAASEVDARLNLGAVYTTLLTLTPEECNLMPSPNGLPDRPARGERRLSALAQLDRHPRLVLLGDPGSGKSTFVNFVALCMAGELLKQEANASEGLGTPSLPNLLRLREPLPEDEEDDRSGDKDKAPDLQPWRHGALLPVRVILRDFAARGLPPAGERATAQHLWAFIKAELAAAALVPYADVLRRTLWEHGDLLLLDGLDEVPAAEQRRVQIKQAVEDFGATFRNVRILATSRTYAYQQQAWRLQDFAEAVLAPFGPGQIARFVERWYAHIAEIHHVHPEDAQGRAALLQTAIARSDRLQGLAARPLLLTLMASLHAWRGGSLPEKREELYADTVDLLLDWWERPKVVRDQARVIVQQPSLAEWLRVGKERVQDVLQHLAFEAHHSQATLVGTADVPEKALIEGLLALNPEDPDVKYGRLVEFLRDRAGLLVPRGVGVYTFPHRTFQEYLAALHLVANDYPAAVARLAQSDPQRWREVALLAGAATTARGSDFALWALVEELCPPGGEVTGGWGALLAGQALAESADLRRLSARHRPKLAWVVQNLIHILEAGALPAVERVAAGVALAKLGDTRPGVGVVEVPRPSERAAPRAVPEIVWCHVPAGKFTMGSPDDSLALFGAKETLQWHPAVPDFWISRYPITQAQYTAFVAAGGYAARRYWTAAGWARKMREQWTGPRALGAPFHLPNHPVVGVSWYEAVAFCRWLEASLRGAGRKLQLWDAGQVQPLDVAPATLTFSLASELQWEKAARGEGPAGRVYPWGDAADPHRANYDETGIGSTSAVGCFPGGASPYGVLDLSGNVWEWCATKFEESYEDYRDDNTLEGDALRVLRGGAFLNDGGLVRCACRFGDYPRYRNGLVGFRVVASPIPLTSD